MPGSSLHGDADRPLSPEEAAALAESMSAFATASRLRILYVLAQGERSVDDLADETGTPASAISQQLRILRHLRLVAARRDGRRMLYGLFDDHVRELLVAIRHHAEHVSLGRPDGSPAAAERWRTRV